MPALLLAAHDCVGHVHLIIGSNSIANNRCAKSIEVGAKTLVIAPASAEVHHALMEKIGAGEVEWIQRRFKDDDLTTLGRKEIDGIVDAVFVTLGGKDSLGTCTTTSNAQSSDLRTHISIMCRRKRIPVNVIDAPELCTFSLPSTHSDGPLQIGITTSNNGCKLATRIRREIASLLPPNFGSAIQRLGIIRRRVWEEDHRYHQSLDKDYPLSGNEDDDLSAQKSTFNQFISESDLSAKKTRRIRWLSQICEYWPLSKLASITDSDVDSILQSYTSSSAPSSTSTTASPLSIVPPRSAPTITLAGSGPGSPSFLTLATHHALLTSPTILADKLVPSPILSLIPRRAHLHIARKFPGNADNAQTELLHLALAALERGESVLRLKQGDPYLYGRGAEECQFFEERGWKVRVLPGVTSALCAPLVARIPPTHRGIADQVLICTGTGRKGAAPDLPAYREGQTVVFLMALHRVGELVGSLMGSGKGNGDWPRDTPCVVVERASCSDQRVIRTCLEHVVEAVEVEGSRPPGLLVLGRACEVLRGREGRRWSVEEGFEGFRDEGEDWIGGLVGEQRVGEGLRELALEREEKGEQERQCT